MFTILPFFRFFFRLRKPLRKIENRMCIEVHKEKIHIIASHHSESKMNRKTYGVDKKKTKIFYNGLMTFVRD